MLTAIKKRKKRNKKEGKKEKRSEERKKKRKTKQEPRDNFCLRQNIFFFHFQNSLISAFSVLKLIESTLVETGLEKIQ